MDDEVPADTDEEWDLATAIADFGAAWRGAGEDVEELEPDREPARVTVVGSLVEGAHVLVIADDGIEVPSRAVREYAPSVWRRAGRAFRGAGQQVEPRLAPDGLPGLPVPAADAVDVPVRVGAPARHRLLGVAMVTAAALSPVGIAFDLFDSWWQAIWVSWGCGAICLAGLRRLASIRLEHSRLVIEAPVRTLFVPWARVHGVRRDDQTLYVACDPDVVVPVGPFGGAATTAEAAAKLGGAMMRLRERALAAGDAGVEPTWAYNPRLGVLVAYAVISIGVLGWHYLPH